MKLQTRLNVLILLFIFINFNLTFAQEKEFLPKGFSEKEKADLLVKGFQFKTSATTAAPSGPVRTAAEWEEVEYLVLSWNNSYDDILSKIVKASIEECKVVIARGSTNESTIRNKLKSSPYSMTDTEIANRIIFLTATTDSIWIRDFAGNTIYSSDVGELGLADWRYNRDRNNDDTVPSSHGSQLGIPVYITNMVNTGGNFMSDGMGNAFASELVIDENDVTPYSHYGIYPEVRRNEAQIDAIMNQYMGITDYYKMPVLPWDEIHHIDMHMKLLDEETILVSTYPGDVADGAQIRTNISDLVNGTKKSVFGTPYKIEYIESPKDKSGKYPHKGGSYCTYSNAVFVNKSILIPTYRASVDNIALAKYRELMPGYTIVGIDVDNNGEDLISLSGAIHCITHTIGVAEPLLIVHQPLEEVSAGSSFNLTAMIKHNSGIQSAMIKWRPIGNTTFSTEDMDFDSESNWIATMPASASNTDIEYYIEATAVSGKVLTRPLVAPDGFWTAKSNSTLAIDEWAEKNISLPYPNPTTDKVSFKLGNIGSSVNISIYTIYGQKLFTNKMNSGNGIIELTLNEEWKGLLLVVFEGDFGKVARKIMKI